MQKPTIAEVMTELGGRLLSGTYTVIGSGILTVMTAYGIKSAPTRGLVCDDAIKSLARMLLRESARTSWAARMY